ncbi:hypothetical protein AAHK20_12530 [Trinickia sp. YCB016]
MAKTSGRKRSQRMTPSARLQMFRTRSWHSTFCPPASEYVSHLLRELGRLGMEIRDIESHDRAPHTQTVLSDLVSWIGEPPSDAFSKLFDWKTLDLPQMRSRLEKDSSAKPRIELSAHVTKMNNLSVRWHPGGWRHSHFDWNGTGQNHVNLISQRKWSQPPDFRWFVGDEQSTFDSRASNELMYIRGVGNLRPEPRESYGPYATYNADVVDSILICAVRSAYEGLIERLQYSFEVDVIDAFDFLIRDEIDEDAAHSNQFPIHRVVAWSLEDADELRIRREQEAAAQQERKDRAELANIALTYGFTLEVFLDALIRAFSTGSIGSAPSDEAANRRTAKDLRSAGFNVNAGHVRHVRQLIERYNPETLPDALRPLTAQVDKDSLRKVIDISAFR